ncbi:transcription factor bHLH167-like [Herrania umbratica]|uniref:Transcription factor bHLH167-like n=1 Tax=Herrania umbratica TaxID=108875 RepID=A0A6J1B2H4_9ROSI|nr:transcription factor bHLH167-like [Herrania umbratica]
MPRGTASLTRMNRNLIERERRSQMKVLFSNLVALLPPHPSKMSIHALLERATIYVNQLQKRTEELKQKKAQLEEGQSTATRISPVIKITDFDSTIQVNLVAGTDMKFALCDIISILEEEGAEVLSATYHIVGNKVVLSLHSQAAYSRIGIQNSRVRDRLKRLQIS